MISDAPARPRPIRISGEASQESTGQSNPLVKTIERLSLSQSEVIFDLTDFEVEEGYPLTMCVNAVRELLVRGARVTLAFPPRVLADALAQAGLLLPPTPICLSSVRD